MRAGQSRYFALQGNFGQNGIIRELAKNHRVVAIDNNPVQKIAGMEKLPSFKSVVLPGRSHLNAPSHPNYIATLSSFLREHDE